MSLIRRSGGWLPLTNWSGRPSSCSARPPVSAPVWTCLSTVTSPAGRGSPLSDRSLPPPEQRDVAAIVIDKMWSAGLPGVSTLLFVVGHFVGAILMGLALRGCIPTVGWLAMLLTTPVHFLAFVFLQMAALDMAAWLLMTLALVCCAIKIIKMIQRRVGSAPSWPDCGPSLRNNLGRDHKATQVVGGLCRIVAAQTAHCVNGVRAGSPVGSSDRVPSSRPVDPFEHRGRLRCGSGYRATPWRPPLPDTRPSRSHRPA
jgi:hypothetical protein